MDKQKKNSNAVKRNGRQNSFSQQNFSLYFPQIHKYNNKSDLWTTALNWGGRIHSKNNLKNLLISKIKSGLSISLIVGL
jgi:hypothetical protein